MTTPTKEALAGKLRKLGWNPPPDASSAELQKLLKAAKNLPAALEVPDRPPAPAAPAAEHERPVAATRASAPPLRPPAPLTRPPLPRSVPAPPAALRGFGAPAVPAPPVPRSDHDRRPHDPFAGW